ncbi:hypothetical protein [Jannaschia sp. W003]|uniref:hypothetical protein n=1 Tax=Jannaschia sp. W003 TaxID=2867012 RepID=UPI0021A716DE|nr:hypothetical protein [Jannaschia sp. W003]UWQ22361.1 hypothetical protein K3554_04815 [Jannaschia sp. W003]
MTREHDDTYRPETDAERGGDARRDPTLSPEARRAADAEAQPHHVTESPSSGAHAAVEAPAPGQGRKLWMVLGAVILVALLFLVFGGLGDEAGEPDAVVVTE